MSIRFAASALAAVAVLAACDSTAPSLFSDAEVTADVAATAGESMVAAVQDMIGNQSAASLTSEVGDPQTANAVAIERSRTCYDANEAVVTNCTPISSVRRIVTNFTASGTRSVERTRPDGSMSEVTGIVHRVASDTLRRIFTGGGETSRSHSGVALGNDTTTFTEGDFTRLVAEQVRDTVKTIVFNLPRSSNPWPASGSIVRATTVKVTLTKGDRTESRELSRTITITFPADNQGNVTMTVNDLTCQLNLTTRRVTNCA